MSDFHPPGTAVPFPQGPPPSAAQTEAQARITLLAALTRLADAATRLIEDGLRDP